MALFDSRFPGHFLRLIRRVQTSVVALVPPNQGIRATLTASGVSRVVTAGDSFQTVVVRRDPETVALDSATSDTGVFDLDPQSEMLLPFEAMGVDTSWEFRLPKPANPFDFETIADVLVTIEYTALDSPDYRQQVTQALDQTVRAEASFSLRDHFPDEWYYLLNPDQADPQKKLVATFSTGRGDFPPNVEEPRIDAATLLVLRKTGTNVELPVLRLSLKAADGSVLQGGSATSAGGIISTRGASGANWVPLVGAEPVGEWELTFDPSAQGAFDDGEIEDVALVLSYSGRTPPWPL
jgi:hypothetical protein